MKSVGCTLTLVKTGLECEIVIGEDKDGLVWKKIGGRLSTIDNGVWFYNWRGSTKDNSKMRGIGLFPRKPGKIDARRYDLREMIFEMDGEISRGFIEKIRCGESLEGNGYYVLTSEKINWKMWFACV